MTLAHWKERASDKQLYIFAFTRALRVILEQQSRHLLSLSKQMGLHGLDEEREQLHLGLYDLWQGKRS